MDKNNKISNQYRRSVRTPKINVTAEKKKFVNYSLLSVAWGVIHDTWLRLLNTEGESRQGFGSKIDCKNLKGCDRGWNFEQNVQDEGHSLGNEMCENIGDELLMLEKTARPSSIA
jgi:hypothetical protein